MFNIDEQAYTDNCDRHSSDLCMDCKENIFDMQEYFMILDELWVYITKGREKWGMLCLGCIEHRLGRTLHKNDFTHCPLNQFGHNKSERVLNRMLTPPPDCECDICTF